MSLTEDVGKDWVVPKVLYVALLDVKPLAAVQWLLPKADQGSLPPLLDVAEMGVLVAEELGEVFSATGLWLLLTPRKGPSEAERELVSKGPPGGPGRSVASCELLG